MTRIDSKAVGDWFDKAQAKDIANLRKDELLSKFDSETLCALYESWCAERKDCLWAAATPKNIADFVKFIKREKQ